MSRIYTKFQEKNIKVIAIARDSPKKLLEFKRDRDITIPIFGDRRGDVVKNYDVYKPAKLSDVVYLKFRLAIPTTYLINTKGIITWAYVGTREDRPEPQLLFQAIEENLPDPPQ